MIYLAKGSGRKALLKAFYAQIARHAFALGVAAAPGPQTYADGLRLADSPLGKAAVALTANEASEMTEKDVRKMATGGLVTEPTLALIGEAGPEIVLPLTRQYNSTPSYMPLAGIPQTRTRKKTKRDKMLSAALKEINKKARLKNGSLRKGWTQKKIMMKAQQLVRRKMKR